MVMKIKIALLIIGLCSAGAAFAQSSVTLYGVADNGLTYTNNQAGGKTFQASSGGLGGSKFGFLGKEDLGGNTAAIFQLESGYSIDNGALGYNGALFGRQAYVGLSGDYGKVLLGRQYDFMVTNLQGLSSAQLFGGALGSHAGDVDGIWGSNPINNVVKYVSPNFNGLQLGSLYSLGGVPGAAGQNRAYGFGATYANGNAKLGAAFLNVSNPATVLYASAASPVPNQSFTDPVTNPIYSGYASARSYQTFGAGGTYALGKATLGVLYTNTRFSNMFQTSSTPASGSVMFNSFEGYASYSFTPAIMAGAAYNFTETDTARYSQVVLGTQYNLSKRTFLYLITAYEHAGGIDSTGHAAVADLTYLTAANGPNQAAVRIGMRHSF